MTADTRYDYDPVSARAILRRLRDARIDALSDPRDPRGRTIPYEALVFALMLGAVAAYRSLRQVEAMTSWLATWFRRKTGIRKRISDTTLGVALKGLAIDDLRHCLHEQIRAEHRRGSLVPSVVPIAVAALDGKGLGKLTSWGDSDVQVVKPRGQAPYGLARVHRTHLVSAKATVAIDQRPIPGNTNELGAAIGTLEELWDAYGHTSLFEVITADAGNCSEAVGRWVNDHDIGYVLAIKEPQGDIYQLAKAELGRRVPSASDGRHQERSHGAMMTWRVYRHGLDGGYLAWTHARELIRIERTVERSDGTRATTGNRYFVTNLVRGRLDAKGWLALIRAHWRCENEGHWTADAVWSEDARRTPWTQGPKTVYLMALLRMIALNILAILRANTREARNPRPPQWQAIVDSVRAVLRHAPPETAPTRVRA